MNLKYLECFTILATNLSFSKTANILKIAQPAVSRQIKMLEESLGVMLFVRDRKRVHLTDAGRKFHKEIAPLLQRIDESVKDIKNEHCSVSGEISFGCLPEVGEMIFYPLIEMFREEYPDVTFNIQYLKSFEIENLLKEGKLDFGIIINPLEQESLRVYSALKQKSYLLTKAGESKSFSSIKELHFAGYRDNDPLVISYMKEFYPKIQRTSIHFDMIANSHASMVSALKKGGLYAILPEYSLPVHEAIKSGELSIASKKVLKSDLYFAYGENDFLEKRKELFRDFILKNSSSFASKLTR